VAAERREAPADDLMTHLVRAEAAGELTSDELIGSSLLLFVAGITTTSGLISNSLLHLVTYPEAAHAMRRDPSTIPGAIEELLRYDAPIQALGRTTTRDVDLHGATIPAARPRRAGLGVRESATTAIGPIRTRSTSPGPRAATCRSAMASTTVSARPSPGSRRRSSSRNCCRASPPGRSRDHRPLADADRPRPGAPSRRVLMSASRHARSGSS
jgi:hypothetical protein